MLDYRIKIGVAPVRRFLPGPKRTGMFNPDYAVENKRKTLAFLRENFADYQTEFVDLEDLNDEGLLIETSECARAEEKFRRVGIDALFIVNCNFGNEEAAGRIARLMKLPTLLWGPRDRIIEPDGTRYTDTQCGLFSISKQLRRNNVPFSYIENCDPDEPPFRRGVERFLAVAAQLKNFRKLRVLQIGTRLRPFKCVMANELELTERFGIDVVPVNLGEVIRRVDETIQNRGEKISENLDRIRGAYDIATLGAEALEKTAAIMAVLRDLEDELETDVVSTECWTGFLPSLGVFPCLAMSVLSDEGRILVCESDIHGAITSALLSCAVRGKEPTFFGEFTVRHPTDDNAELLWHCGVFPPSLRADHSPRGLTLGKPDFRVRDGHYTVARFQGDRGNYTLAAGEFETTDGPNTAGTYLWAKFRNLVRLERKLVEGPYIHHMSETPGAHAETLREFTRFVPGLTFDPLEE